MHPSVHARSQPDKAAYIMAGSGTVVSYGQLEERSRRCAQLLRGLGLMAGDTIAICMDNNPRYFELCWAAQRSGLYYTCVSNRLTAPEVEYIVRDSGARVLFLSVSQRAIAAELAHSLGDIERFSVDGSINGYLDYESTRERFPAEPVADETAGSDMLYSSGTTGRPKGVRVALSGMPPDAPLAAGADPQRLYGFGERLGVPVAGAAVSRRAAALLHGRAAPRRHRDRDGELRPGGGAGADRAPPRHALAVGADDVRAHAQAARGSARSLRPLEPACRDPRRGALPDRRSSRR